MTMSEYRKKYPDITTKSAHEIAQQRFTIKKRTKKKKLRLKWSDLNEEEQQILLGCYLGDGYINKYKNRPAYFEVYHSNTQQFYLNWLVKKLKKLNAKKHKWTRYWKEYGRVYTRHWMTTSSCPAVEYLYDLFHIDNKKTITTKFLNLLKPQGIAVWFMDDGGRHKTELNISTHAYSYKENELIVKWLKKKYKINSNIRLNKEQPYIVILQKDKNIDKFINLIKKYILPEFQYKIDFDEKIVKLKYVDIVKKLSFHSAHFLEDYYSKCFLTHGERYVLEIKLRLPIDPLTGFAIDFQDIEEVFEETVKKRFDHKTINLVCEELRFNATAELLIVVIWNLLVEQLPGLYELTLYENPVSWVTYRGGE